MAAAPTKIQLHQKSRTLELHFDDAGSFQLSCEYLRVFSPSAEVRGHGKGQEVLQTGKRNVTITAIEPVGNYALRFTFSDGHNTGLYSWDYLRGLCLHKDDHWNDYLSRLHKHNATRDPDTSVVKLFPASPQSKS